MIILLLIILEILVFSQDPNCENGIIKNNICCLESCGTCGGLGCSLREGGGEGCCGGPIIESGLSCNVYNSPCIILENVPTMAPNSLGGLYMDYPVQEDYVSIIGYHRIEDAEATSTISNLENFKLQIEWLSNKCNWLTMTDLSYYILNKEKIPTKACVITFDDGLASQYENGICVLNDNNIPATFYISTNDIDRIGYYMTWNEVENLNHSGHDIEAHGRTHEHLAELNYTRQEYEIIGSYIDLRDRGYNVSSFAYPYGEYNNDTLDILKEYPKYKIGRQISKKTKWDKRPVTISYDEDYIWNLHYIKPEFNTPEELENLIKYTGWWQFEEEYKVINGNSIKALTSDIYLSTETSYGILALYEEDDEISMKFLIKNEGAFTIEIIVYSNNIFEVSIDNNNYNVITGNNIYSSSSYDFKNYYININNLKSGVHIINVKNMNGVIYLDKYRIFSDTEQDFYKKSDYKKCDDCNCDIFEPTLSPTIEISDPTCENGIINGDICCASTCINSNGDEQCGGVGCGALPGGGSMCCGGSIGSSGRLCNINSAPCIITESPLETPTLSPIIKVEDPTCENGIKNEDICCVSSCINNNGEEQCGGVGCGVLPGGGEGCCGGTIRNAELYCENNPAPCLLF